MSKTLKHIYKVTAQGALIPEENIRQALTGLGLTVIVVETGRALENLVDELPDTVPGLAAAVSSLLNDGTFPDGWDAFCYLDEVLEQCNADNVDKLSNQIYQVVSGYEDLFTAESLVSELILFAFNSLDDRGGRQNIQSCPSACSDKQSSEKKPKRKNTSAGTLKIRFGGTIYCERDGISTLVEPWFDIKGKLPFEIPQDPDTSDVFFFALYNPDSNSMKYICFVEDSEGERRHEFEITEQDKSLLKEGMEKLCRKENNCDLATYWSVRGRIDDE